MEGMVGEQRSIQQDDGPTLRRMVAIEIYSNDIITEGYFDSLLFMHFMNMGIEFIFNYPH
jgi:hypothetical protein